MIASQPNVFRQHADADPRRSRKPFTTLYSNIFGAARSGWRNLNYGIEYGLTSGRNRLGTMFNPATSRGQANFGRLGAGLMVANIAGDQLANGNQFSINAGVAAAGADVAGVINAQVAYDNNHWTSGS